MLLDTLLGPVLFSFVLETETSEGKPNLQGSPKTVRARTEVYETTLKKQRTVFNHGTSYTVCVVLGD